MRVLHVITNLEAGGAQAVLRGLVAADPDDTHQVVSLMGHGVHGGPLAAAGVPVHALGMPRGRLAPRGLARLRDLMRRARPDVVQTWMYHADLLGGAAARLAGLRGVVWGLHNANLDPRSVSAATRSVVRLCALVSGLVPARIVSCSERAARLHAALGYRADRIEVVPNGYDLRRFAPDPGARARLRAQLGVPEDCRLLGTVARWHPHKDHATLAAALGRLDGAAAPRWRCLLAGDGMDGRNAELARLLERSGVADRLLLLGPRDDVPALLNALDLHVLSSSGEAFPNVVAEAMACGTPAVVTDAGDAALIVGETGWVVPVGDAPALAASIARALREAAAGGGWEARRRACRERIAGAFGLERMVRGYRAVWEAARRA